MKKDFLFDGICLTWISAVLILYIAGVVLPKILVRFGPAF